MGCGVSQTEMPVNEPFQVEIQETSINISDSSQAIPLTQPLSLNEQEFLVEIADTPLERQQGLMNRNFMPEHQGMLFVFEAEGLRSFWMKNTLIPLDMIWLDSNRKIVDIQTADPCRVENCPSYLGNAPAQYVLELNQGVLNAAVGDTVEF